MNELYAVSATLGVGASLIFFLLCGFRVRRDVLFLFFMLQVAIYVYVSPLASLIIESDQYTSEYLRLWAAASRGGSIAA